MTIYRTTPSAWQNFCRRLVLKRLAHLEHGSLQIAFPDGSMINYGDITSEHKASLTINDNKFFSRIVLGGDVGLGESYVEGLWDSPDVVSLFELFIANRDCLADGSFLMTTFARVRDRVRHLLRDNTLQGSSRNIREHYDLGNDFYKTFLDASMTYSCALYQSPDETLEEAQKNKKRAIIQKLQIGPNDHVLEIGCGWGGFAIEAVRQTGCRVTGITLSPSQKEWAEEQVQKAGLEDRIDIRLADYRHIKGHYDRIVSIEMLEAVGHRWMKHFFQHCDSLLKPGGLMGLQTITIPCEQYENYRRGTDWIRKHIFPGGHLPSLSSIREAISDQTSFAIHEMHEIGHFYAYTLREWRNRFLAQIPTIETFGFGQSFHRKWDYYLATCESGFAARATGTVQIVLAKEG